MLNGAPPNKISGYAAECVVGTSSHTLILRLRKIGYPLILSKAKNISLTKYFHSLTTLCLTIKNATKNDLEP